MKNSSRLKRMLLVCNWRLNIVLSLANAYTQVKQRLDYQMELGNVMRRVEQRHMVDWIISNVRKSITAKQEDEALKKCVADLKALAK